LVKSSETGTKKGKRRYPSSSPLEEWAWSGGEGEKEVPSAESG